MTYDTGMTADKLTTDGIVSALPKKRPLTTFWQARRHGKQAFRPKYLTSC